MRKTPIFHEPLKTIEELEAMTIEQIQKEVLNLLCWNEEDLSCFIYECGVAYLQAYFGNDTDAISHVEHKREFWNWFKNQWQYRDQVFFESMILDFSLPLFMRREMYKALHSPAMLACEIYPSKTVLGTDFSTLKIHA
jgi:hypothetical protein